MGYNVGSAAMPGLSRIRNVRREIYSAYQTDYLGADSIPRGGIVVNPRLMLHWYETLTKGLEEMASAPGQEMLWHYRAKLVRVIDGDTLVVLVDTGFYARHEVHIRLARFNAAELSTDVGEDAKQFLMTYLEHVDTLGEWPLTVITLRTADDSHEKQTFTRYVGEVWARNQNLSDLMIHGGWNEPL